MIISYSISGASSFTLGLLFFEIISRIPVLKFYVLGITDKNKFIKEKKD